MSRALVVPALLCIVVGAVLGAWGHGDRDASRARIVAQATPDDPEVGGDDGGGIFGSPAEGHAQQREAACAALSRAADLRLPEAGPLLGTDPDPVEQARALSYYLTPDLVEGIPGLDDLGVQIAIAELQRSLRRAVDAGRDPAGDPAVQVAADDLGRIVAERC